MPEVESLTDEVDVRCLACGGTLHFLPDSYPLVFRCRKAHLFILNDLLNHGYPESRGGQTASTQATLAFWKERARLFRDLAARALHNSHAFVAADFNEAANRIDGWASNLETLISKVGT